MRTADEKLKAEETRKKAIGALVEATSFVVVAFKGGNGKKETEVFSSANSSVSKCELTKALRAQAEKILTQ